jgi:hypothetical protein
LIIVTQPEARYNAAKGKYLPDKSPEYAPDDQKKQKADDDVIKRIHKGFLSKQADFSQGLKAGRLESLEARMPGSGEARRPGGREALKLYSFPAFQLPGLKYFFKIVQGSDMCYKMHVFPNYRRIPT